MGTMGALVEGQPSRTAMVVAQIGERVKRGPLRFRLYDMGAAQGLTLVTISYAAAGERLGMAYTPFGVTAVMVFPMRSA